MNKNLSELKKRELINFGVAMVFILAATMFSAIIISAATKQLKTVTDEPILRERQSSSIFTYLGQTTPYNEVYSVIERKPDYTYLAAAEPIKTARYILTEEEKRLLCFVADHEDFTSVESRQAVMQVVMNRTESDKFPDTVADVLYQKRQFAVMKRYASDYIPTIEALVALERLLYSEDVFGGECALFFARADVKPERIAKGLYEVARIGGSKFWGQE